MSSFVPGHEAALAAEALREGAEVEVDVLVDAEVLGDAAAVGAEQEGRVRLVDQHARAVALGDLEDLGQRAHVAVHRVDALDDDQLLALDAVHLALEVERVVVAEEDGLGLGEDRAVHDRGVRVLVEEDRVARAHQRRDEADVGAVARGEQHHGFLVLEAGELLGELLVHVEGARQDRRARRPEAVALDRLRGGLLHLGPVGDAEVVVGGEVQQVVDGAGLAVLDPDVGGGRRGQRLHVQVVPGGPRLAIPVGVRPQQVERVVAGAVVEVAVVVLRELRLLVRLLLRRLHRVSSLSGHAYRL